jgi:hypothetical protein
MAFFLENAELPRCLIPVSGQSVTNFPLVAQASCLCGAGQSLRLPIGINSLNRKQKTGNLFQGV